MTASSSASGRPLGAVFSPDLRAQAEELIGRYPGSRSALLPLLHLVQHVDGYISDDGVAECASLLGLTKAEVGAVATFYTMYKREPMGRHLVSVCTNFSCAVRGSTDVYEALSAKLGVGHNGTTADGVITLEHAECLGNCEGAPVVSVDYLNYETLSPEQALSLVEALISGVDVPPPTRGYVPPGIRDVQQRLAGLGGGDGALSDAATSQARADDGAVPTPAAGPGGDQVTIDVALAPEWEEARRDEVTDRAADRRDAEEVVREVGQDPDELADQAGDKSREFPTAGPDGEAEPVTGDVRAQAQVTDEAADRDAQVIEGDESTQQAEEPAEQAERTDAAATDEGEQP